MHNSKRLLKSQMSTIYNSPCLTCIIKTAAKTSPSRHSTDELQREGKTNQTEQKTHKCWEKDPIYYLLNGDTTLGIYICTVANEGKKLSLHH